MNFNRKTVTAYGTFYTTEGAQDAVLYTEQELNEAQKAQARQNIGAAIECIDGSNATPPLVLMDLEPGSYVLNGTFAYSSNPENGQYPFVNTLVQIDEVDDGQKSVSFQVADEIICIFFTYDSYKFKRYNLADMGNGGSADGAVLYTEQTLTDEEKAIARANIGAANADNRGNLYLYDEIQDNYVCIAVSNNDKDESGYSTNGVLCFLGSGDSPVKLKRIADGTDDWDAATVGQLNEAVGNIETALDSIIAIQESLIGGAAE